MSNKKILYSGFTLIELLIVIALIGILAAGVALIVNPQGQIGKAQDANRKNDLRQIKNALEGYYNDNGSYPPTDTMNSILNAGSAWSNYISKVPQDPKYPAKRYGYTLTQSGQGYRLYASLDISVDPQACDAACPGASAAGISCGTSMVCNYGVTSSNETR